MSRPGSQGEGERPPIRGRAGMERADERRLLARYAKTRDPDVLDALVEHFMPLAKKLASRYRGGAEPFDDLLQVAHVGLVKAIGRFDPDRGLAFSSFAFPTILGELKRYFRDHTWSVHVGREISERHSLVRRATAELPGTLGRAPSIDEIAGRLDISAEEVLEVIDAENNRQAVSLDRVRPRGDGDEGPTLVESLGEEDPAYEIVEYEATLAPALTQLSPRDREVLHLRFAEDMTQSDIAERVGVSQMQVSRILRSALRRLREQVPESERAG